MKALLYLCSARMRWVIIKLGCLNTTSSHSKQTDNKIIQQSGYTVYQEILATILFWQFGDSEVNRQIKKLPIIRY